MSTRSERTHLAILDASWKRLSKGDPARLEDVADDAGVTRQAVYLHFGSRGGLLIELVDHMDDKLGLHAMLAEVDGAATPEEALLMSLRVTARYASKIQGVAMSLVRLADTDPDARATLANRMTRRRRGFRALLRAIEARGMLAPGWTAERATDALWAAGAPENVGLLVGQRGWSEADLEQWLVHLGRSLLREAGASATK